MTKQELEGAILSMNGKRYREAKKEIVGYYEDNSMVMVLGWCDEVKDGITDDENIKVAFLKYRLYAYDETTIRSGNTPVIVDIDKCLEKGLHDTAIEYLHCIHELRSGSYRIDTVGQAGNLLAKIDFMLQRQYGVGIDTVKQAIDNRITFGTTDGKDVSFFDRG
jgi:hypothetical protein